MKHQRIILAVNSAGLPKDYSISGFFSSGTESTLLTMYEAGLWLGPRASLEINPSFKQLIPYIVLRVGNKFVRYHRTLAGGESRLHGRYSIGLGGHIDLSDVSFENNSVELEKTLTCASEREVREELGEVRCLHKVRLGVIVDNSNEVGKVHIGIVEVWEVENNSWIASEEAIGDVQLVTLCELRAETERLETWSAMLLDELEKLALA